MTWHRRRSDEALPKIKVSANGSTLKLRYPEGWLEALTRAPLRTKRAPGVGLDFDFKTTSVYGSGLWHEDRPAHMAMFSN